MKLPRSLKLPRKLKKELKKGFTRNIHPSFPTFKKIWNPITASISCSMYQNISYSGSNTKSFFRLCKFARKEEKQKLKNLHESIANEILNKHLEFQIPDDNILSLSIGMYCYNYDKRDVIREQEAKLDLQFIQEHGAIYKPDSHALLYNHSILEH